MTKTSHFSLGAIGGSLIAIGAIISMVSAQMNPEFGAALTHQGSYIGSIEPIEPMWIAQETVLPAAMEPDNSLGVLAFGMLMMLIGFGLHAFLVVHNNQTKVPVKSAKKIATKKAPRSSRKQMDVIWVERTIRF